MQARERRGDLQPFDRRHPTNRYPPAAAAAATLEPEPGRASPAASSSWHLAQEPWTRGDQERHKEDSTTGGLRGCAPRKNKVFFRTGFFGRWPCCAATKALCRACKEPLKRCGALCSCAVSAWNMRQSCNAQDLSCGDRLRFWDPWSRVH